MKILHVITSLRAGGAEKITVDLLPRLQTKGYEVELLVFDGVETSFMQEIKRIDVKVIHFGKLNSVYNPKNILRLRKLISDYDIVHTHNYTPQLFAAIASIGKDVNLITTEHGGSNRRRRFKLFSYIDRWMYRRYSKVICISDNTLDSLKQFTKGRLKNLLIVNNGVDVKKFEAASPSLELESIAPSSRKIIMVAGFRWEKDQDTLIKAVKDLPSVFHLFLVGDGVRRSELENLVSRLDLRKRVHFLGLRSDVANLLHAADYIVMSSHFEGLSLSSVEGMCVGKPFLASDVDGLREVVSGAGILFPHQDHKALAKAILNLNDNQDLYNSVAAKCRERAPDFDISKMVEGYGQVYASLTNSKS